MVLRVLRLVAQVEALAERDEERARAVEDDPRAPMVRAGVGRLLTEDHLQVLERRAGAIDLRARDRGSGAAVAAVLGKAQVDHAIAGEIRIGKHVEQAALAAGENLRQPGEGLRELAPGRHHPKPPGPFRHEHGPIRQEGESPGMLEPAHDRLDDEVRLLGLHLQRLLRQRRSGQQQESKRRSRRAHEEFLSSSRGKPAIRGVNTSGDHQSESKRVSWSESKAVGVEQRLGADSVGVRERDDQPWSSPIDCMVA